jgi:hypothetical protein
MTKALTLIILLLLCPIYSSSLDTYSPSVLIGDFQDRTFTQQYLCAVNIGTGNGFGVRNNTDNPITITMEYGIWTLHHPLIRTNTTSFILPAGKTAAIIDPRIQIEHIRSILKLWVNERLITDKTREDIPDSNPILLFQY